jgi:hypothetical protein
MLGKHEHDLLSGRGARLREVRRDLLRQNPGATQRWFQGPEGTDLFLWYDDRRGLVQIQLTFEQLVLEWAEDEGVHTGHLTSFDPLHPLTDQGKLVFDPALDGGTQERASAVLEQATVDELTLAMVRSKLGLKK